MRCNGIITGAGPFRSRPREDYPGRSALTEPGLTIRTAASSRAEKRLPLVRPADNDL